MYDIADTNECDITAVNKCNVAKHAYCVNKNKGYQCDCKPGYTINPDGLTCSGKLYHLSD